MSLTINEGSEILRPYTFKQGDLIIISIGNALGYAIYEKALSDHKLYYYYLGSRWHWPPYEKEMADGTPSWLYRRINDPKVGARDFTNTHADKRIFPLPKEMCTKKLLEIQNDYKKARNLI